MLNLTLKLINLNYKTKQFYHIFCNVEKIKTNERKLTNLWNCVASDSKKVRFFKNQEDSGLLSKFELEAFSNKIQLLGDIFLEI